MPEGKSICFVICPIGDEGTPARKRSDDVLELVIRPAAEELGYRAERTTEAPRPGWITERIVRYLLDSPMVVADLSGRNPNVFYELAIRHVVRKPFVQIMQVGEEVPFDVFGLETIFYEYGDWSSAAAARKRLVEQMRVAAERPEAIRTPVSIAGDLAALQGGQAPTEALLRDLLELQRETLHRLDGRDATPWGQAAPWGRVELVDARLLAGLTEKHADFRRAVHLLPFVADAELTEEGFVVRGPGLPKLATHWSSPILSRPPEELPEYLRHTLEDLGASPRPKSGRRHEDGSPAGSAGPSSRDPDCPDRG